MVELLPHAEYLATLPRKRMAAGVIIRDDAERVLLVKPTYREGWDLPGGVVEVDESPAQAAEREVHEELGRQLHLGRLLGVTWKPPSTTDPHGQMIFDYDGGVWPPSQIGEVRLQTDELSEFRLVPRGVIATLVPAARNSRILAALGALTDGGVSEQVRNRPGQR